MGKICLQCGNKGSPNAFVYCIRCLKFVVHRYCLDVIPKTVDEFVHWVCGDDCESVTQKRSVKRTIDKSTKSGPDKSNDNLPILLPEGEEDILPLELKKKKGNLSGRKRFLLSDALEKNKKQKRATMIQPSTINDENSLQNIVSTTLLKLKREKGDLLGRKRLLLNGGSRKIKKQKKTTLIQPSRRLLLNVIQPSTKNREEGVIKVCHYTKPLSEVDDGQKLISVRSSKKKKTTKRKKKILASSKEINGVWEVNHTSSQEQVRNNRESNVDNRDTCSDFPNDLHVSSPDPIPIQIWREPNVNNRERCRGFPKGLHFPFPDPVAMPVWRGSFDITDRKYMILNGLLAHVSILACQKVFEEASLLEPVLHLEMLPKSDVWPKSFETLPPRGDNIALYFFPSKSSERDFERLIEEMKHEELAMKVVTQNADLLVFDSTELPLLYWKFHAKYYLWGVFKQKQITPSSSHPCEREKMT